MASLGGKLPLPLLLHQFPEQVGKGDCFFFAHFHRIAMRIARLDEDYSFVIPKGDVLNWLEDFGHATSV